MGRTSIFSFFRFLDAYEQRFAPIRSLDDLTEALGTVWLEPIDGWWEAPVDTHFMFCRSLVLDAHERQHGKARPLDWPLFPRRDSTAAKDAIPEPEARAALSLLKREAWKIYARWTRADALAAQGRNLLLLPRRHSRRVDFAQHIAVSEADLHRTYRALIEKTGDPLPTYADLHAILGTSGRTKQRPNWWRKTGISLFDLQSGLYPTLDDLHCLSQLFMARTGWNAATVTSLDIRNTDWARRHGSPEVDIWVIESWKDRSKDWQQTMCRGKTSTAPYVIASKLLERTASLRDLVKRSPERCLNPTTAERSPWLAVGDSAFCGCVLVLDGRLNTGAASKYWRGLVDAHNAEAFTLNERSELASAASVSGDRPSPRRTIIRESMVPSDWRDIFADHVFVDSRYSWVMVQWALGHKHLKTTRRYLRTRLWRRFSEGKLSELQVAMTNDLWHHGRLDAVFLRAKVEHSFDPASDDISRLEQHRRVVRERELTISGYYCQDPFNPPEEIDPGNPCDGSTRCRRGERCPGCPIAIAVDCNHMVRRMVELRVIRREVPVGIWLDSQYASDLEILEADLTHWPLDEIRSRQSHWEAEIASGRHRIIRFGGRNVL